jgi:hypothetical protein
MNQLTEAVCPRGEVAGSFPALTSRPDEAGVGASPDRSTRGARSRC